MKSRPDTFYFKQFHVRHDRCTMKVGTDAVLLGAWVNTQEAITILDIGTGSGIIALMLAQRSCATARIDAVEIEQEDASQAQENILQSPWPDKVQVCHNALQHFHPDKNYDLIVSNPPFFNNSQEPPEVKRYRTRHTVALSHHDLLSSVQRLLGENGTFAVILPYQEGLQFITLATSYNLYCSRQWSFRTRKEKPVERWLLEFTKTTTGRQTGEILLYEKGHEWSAGYKALTKDFYLKI